MTHKWNSRKLIVNTILQIAGFALVAVVLKSPSPEAVKLIPYILGLMGLSQTTYIAGQSYVDSK